MRFYSTHLKDMAIRLGLCLLFIVGGSMTPLMAQDMFQENRVDDTAERDSAALAKLRRNKKAEKQYPMKSVSGKVIDDATG